MTLLIAAIVCFAWVPLLLIIAYSMVKAAVRGDKQPHGDGR